MKSFLCAIEFALALAMATLVLVFLVRWMREYLAERRELRRLARSRLLGVFSVTVHRAERRLTEAARRRRLGLAIDGPYRSRGKR